MRLVSELNGGQLVHRFISKEAVILAVVLALLGMSMTAYLTLVLAQPDALAGTPSGGP